MGLRAILTTRVLKYLVLLAFALLIVAISSFWFSGPSFSEKNVVFEIDGPTQVSSGEEVVFKLKYENKTRSTLYDLDFVFYYPEGSTVLIDGRPEKDHVEDFKIDELTAGEKGEREFSAFLIGERGNIKVTKAILTFRSGNLRSSFEKSISLSTTIVTTPISLTLAAPPSVVSDSPIQYVLDYRNESDEDAQDLIMEFDYPDGFSPKSYSINPESGNNKWTVKTLKVASGGRITVDGVLSGKEGENKVISTVLKRKVGGQYVDYQKVSAVTVISNPILGLVISVNKVSDYSASLGDRLNYTVDYSNDSNLTLSGMNLSVKLEGDMFDFSRLDTRGGLFDDFTKTITWDLSTISDFSNFFPNAKGQIIFNIPIKSFFSSAMPGASNERFVKATAKFRTPNIPVGSDVNEIATSASIITRIGTQPALNQSAYYNDPDFGFSGPLPPRVDEETIYTVHWQLTNPGNDTENAKIVAKLPSGAVWVDIAKTTANQPLPVFNPNSSEVSWSLPRIPYGAGVSTEKYEASFRIKIKPSSIQRGNVISIIEGALLTGTDSFTKQSIIINRSGINTDNLTDRPREGTVQ
ncbi:MAG: hypothetical protein A3B91_02805 [Candidatus Yanofskybacteria bacterium RIFCSPHIGHO2_02_FULL_41_29]|uniref:DUF11 domain-containing protein n=1 Tax=Candidatus Yanofskybacteria bacterium RIFCSPHIGHO2_01_FULL_41_53 TaxID=1802663 RepID=A0A1F8EK92_9BACT|nr:MAG: hypothetical protein A2650_02155 [Candidatus Yanofskybacteria bacterium RIFCSPHIGHO2_01_FULL_41_53]OGN12194.1 MAG: hypothetical protein A3B91_02805 [Candidatus Yanofskybacteria bacterium RIFCSPHIGHO2_02_FULL_41_29]OGN17633.1 MAG: hypothetical protein A3F48_02705 [Candidatus Yanofskybacteria bacterium RIFCSPHIGHO2_12_FULL_41_9]OGN23808.1 MAG: hypothetical protein A2916_01085 [Candidatus Yanofskybacteria bacterium RIFCSPLOWO2_01_FULL_41_67]OGN28544.1 MAG: hypothetical protein A3H54_04790 